MPALLSDRPAPTAAPVAAPRRRRRIPVRLVVAGAAVAVLLPAGLEIRDWVAGFGDSFEPEVVDRSTPPLLLALEDLSEYRAAEADLQTVIDIETDTPWLPSVISGERVSFLATGTADAFVDFEQIGEGAVTLSPDGSSATIVLPAPELGEVRIDPENSRVLDRDRGLVERLSDAIEENPSDDSELYALAERRLAAAAAESDVLDRAEANTRDMLTTLAGSLGVDEVTVEFEEPVRGGA